jgi:hypothetical protein
MQDGGVGEMIDWRLSKIDFYEQPPRGTPGRRREKNRIETTKKIAKIHTRN